MKKEYSRYIKNKFKQIIQKEFSCYKFIDKRKDFGLDYNFMQDDNKSFKMISIQNSHDENAFMTELFWSNSGQRFQNDLTHFRFENSDDVLSTICKESTNSLRIRLSIFHSHEFDSWWAIDPTGNIVDSIKIHGYITSDAYFKFYSEDTFLSDDTELEQGEYEKYIDPLVYNTVDLLKKYAMSLFECLDRK
jgi:hypothetical protein